MVMHRVSLLSPTRLLATPLNSPPQREIAQLNLREEPPTVSPVPPESLSTLPSFAVLWHVLEDKDQAVPQSRGASGLTEAAAAPVVKW